MGYRQRVVDRLRAGLPQIGVDWGWGPQGQPVPRVTVIRVGGGADYSHDGDTRTGRALLQVDIWAEDVEAADALSTAVRAALSGWMDRPAIKGCFLTAERDLSPEDEGADLVARITLDFTLQYEDIEE